MTSHEMRNPLSAILQCADIIMTSLCSFRPKMAETDSVRSLVEELLDSSLDAAETITLCAQHQKRIIDDVLTLSKLDSEMLLITPVEVQPLQVVQHVLRIFKGESKKNDITMSLHLEDSYFKTRVDWVRLDPSRLTQVLVNIVGNAIKFTQSSAEKRITVSLGASLREPSEHDQQVEYIPVHKTINMQTEGATDLDEGTGEPLYLQFSVQDTGRGLSPDEKQLLFTRFGQGKRKPVSSVCPIGLTTSSLTTHSRRVWRLRPRLVHLSQAH